MKPYPEYKETGLSWLPKIPKHWEVVRAKQLFKIIDIRSESGDEELLSVSERYGVVKRENVKVTMFMANSYEGYKLCWPNDLVVNSLWAWSYGLGFSQYHGIISTAYSVYRLKDKTRALPRYFDYFVRGKDFHWELRIRSKGLWKSRYQLSDDSFLSAPVILPPMEEQKRIVRYLDLMTAKIDKLIDAKKKQIALLQEKKQAIVNQVVTRGLNPDVQLKDSGIDWLGKIPVHWEIRPLKYFAESNLKSLSQDTDDDFSFSYIDISSVGYGYIRAELEQMRFADAPSRARRLVSVGDTIISTVRTHLRSICLIDENLKDCVVSTGFSVLHPSKQVLPQILNFALSTDAFINSVIQNSIGISYPAIADSRLLSLKIALPPSMQEQRQIVDFILKETQRYDIAQKNTNREIHGLEDYKNSLISSVVLGKIDVCSMKIPGADFTSSKASKVYAVSEEDFFVGVKNL